jgi:hypothetical protein
MLEKRLKKTFRLVYAEGPIAGVHPGPDVTSVYKDYAPFRAWLRDNNTPGIWTSQNIADGIDASLALAMTADDTAGATGDWIGLLGFSQGAKVAASILYRQQRCGGSSFQFAVLLAGRGPLVWLMPELPMPLGLVDAATPSTHPAPAWLPLDSDEHILSLPSIHVHGLKDPGLERHRDLLRDYCNPLHATLLEWDGDHRIPIKSRDVDTVVQEIHKAAQVTKTRSLVVGLARMAMRQDIYVRPADKGFTAQVTSICTEEYM